ncbi:4-hydroxythreonine-4-phosphate dehydrogenase PdxA [Leptolyngbya sp. O-77]|uniref:4-hydroxythreonine-4-phosphate dehydrogenase PdxA n=1 Tax=Leptolyngbya sp. O-77 TaxID=1080068 RepID=UPI00074D4515|nr:4-hydroxythreonine-4-phosphate dehydrogenase PdxA [Leptolyngbya sp. O-77]BAU40242.1 4-hydroxythreonine-4-phosphate dehydrogenase 1 [Leptolyngbya sp. O-77]
MVQPRVAIALGDPAGIGLEVVLKALMDLTTEPPEQPSKITLVGNRVLLEQTCDRLVQAGCSHLPDLSTLDLLEVPLDSALMSQIAPGEESAASGEASFRFLQTAIAHTLAGEFDGIVTAPIAKSAWKAAGHVYPGQTELLAEQAGVTRFGMMFVGRSPHTGWTLRALLATTHIPLRQVPDALSPNLMTRKLGLLIDSLRDDFGILQPRVAIAGLNPHSGEQGQLGREELEWLTPWIHQMRQQHPHLTLDGPIPPDTLWVRPGQAWFGTSRPVQTHDAYLALYHDQGLIPVKLMAFDCAVNTTIGLPFVRTSPDHGTAFDIAGQGVADASSMKAAILLAIGLSAKRLIFPQPLQT